MSSQIILHSFLMAAAVCSSSVRADIIDIGPFSGDRHEPLNFSTTMIVSQLPIFGGAGVLRSWNGTTLIHLLLGDTFNSVTVTPRTGQYILGFTEGPGIFEFDPPVRRFGAYFNNNSGASNAMVEFFAPGGPSLGLRTATTPFPNNVWTWNGWESDAPIGRIVVTGNGLLHGWLWFDDLEISYVPSPAAAWILVAPMLWRRRRGPTTDTLMADGRSHR